MDDKTNEYEIILKEARQVLDDWCDEYGHYELELMRDKIDVFLDKCHRASTTADTKNTCPFCFNIRTVVKGICPACHRDLRH